MPETSCHERNLCEHGEDGGTGKGEERGTEDIGARLERWRRGDNRDRGVLRRNWSTSAGRRTVLSTRADWDRSRRRWARVVLLAGWRRAVLTTGADWCRSRGLGRARNGAVAVGRNRSGSRDWDVRGLFARADRDLRRARSDGHNLGGVDSGIGVGGSESGTDEGSGGDGEELHFEYVVGLRVVRRNGVQKCE